MDEKWIEIAPDILDYNDTLPVEKRERVAKEVLDYYLGPGEKINKENFKKLTQVRYFQSFLYFKATNNIFS